MWLHDHFRATTLPLNIGLNKELAAVKGISQMKLASLCLFVIWVEC